MTNAKQVTDPKQVTGANHSANYGADEIIVLEGLEAVRKRPGMYIGNTGQDGLHRCLGEIVDNCVDEFMAGEASNIRIVINPSNNTIFVADDGRGIPTDTHTKTGKSALETIMTVLHAGGKFNQDNYQFSGGLHGVGASVVNALSEKMQVWVLRDSKLSYLAFARGKTDGDIQVFDAQETFSTFPELIEKTVWKKHGTIVAFQPDREIFETVEFNTRLIMESLKQTAYLNKGLRIIVEVVGEKASKDETEEQIFMEELKKISDKELMDMVS